MNFWIINQHGTGPDEPATRSYDIGKELFKKGHKVTVFASGFSFYERKERGLQTGEMWKSVNLDNVRFIWLKTFPYKGNDWRRVINMLSYAFMAFWVGMRLKQKPDIIMGINPPPPAVFSAYVLSLFKKSRFFLEVKDLWPQTLVSMGALSEKSPVTWLMRKFEKLLYNKAEKIIVLLPHAVEYIARLNVPRNKVTWIPNGVDLSRFENLKIYDGGISEIFTVMYLGGHTASNALDIVLNAAKILQDQGKINIRFVLVGDGAEKPNLLRLSRGLGLSNVEFRPKVPKADISEIMGGADAFISSLRNVPGLHKYGISLNKIFDYLSSGRPVILAGNASNNPIEEAGAGITIPPEDPLTMAQAIIKLISLTPEERIKMGGNGIEYIRKNNDIRILAKIFEKLMKH